MTSHLADDSVANQFLRRNADFKTAPDYGSETVDSFSRSAMSAACRDWIISARSPSMTRSRLYKVSPMRDR